MDRTQVIKTYLELRDYKSKSMLERNAILIETITKKTTEIKKETLNLVKKLKGELKATQCNIDEVKMIPLFTSSFEELTNYVEKHKLRYIFISDSMFNAEEILENVIDDIGEFDEDDEENIYTHTLLGNYIEEHWDENRFGGKVITNLATMGSTMRYDFKTKKLINLEGDVTYSIGGQALY